MQRSNPEINREYHSTRWKRLKQIKKKTTPYCEECLKEGKYTPVYIIHHKEWINEENYKDNNVFYNIDNLESVCLEHHNKIHFAAEQEYYFNDNGDLIKKEANHEHIQNKT